MKIGDSRWQLFECNRLADLYFGEYLCGRKSIDSLSRGLKISKTACYVNVSIHNDSERCANRSNREVAPICVIRPCVCFHAAESFSAMHDYE